jgi:hypothetical protein
LHNEVDFHLNWAPSSEQSPQPSFPKAVHEHGNKARLPAGVLMRTSSFWISFLTSAQALQFGLRKEQE